MIIVAALWFCVFLHDCMWAQATFYHYVMVWKLKTLKNFLYPMIIGNHTPIPPQCGAMCWLNATSDLPYLCSWAYLHSYWIGCHTCYMYCIHTQASCHVWWGVIHGFWGDYAVCGVLHCMKGSLYRIWPLLCVFAYECKGDSSPAAMRTATTGSSSVTGESVGVLTKMEEK